MKTLKARHALQITILLNLPLMPSHAVTITAPLNIEDIVADAFGTGTIESGATATIDVFNHFTGTGSVASPDPDGYADFRVTYQTYQTGDASVSSMVHESGAVTWSASSGAEVHQDYAFQSLRIDFLTVEVNAMSMSDFSQSGANGSSSEYEFGISEIIPAGGLAKVTSDAIGSYDPEAYVARFGAATLIHDLAELGGGNRVDGVAFYTDATWTAFGSGIGGGASIATPDSEQHYLANAVGSGMHHFYSVGGEGSAQDTLIGSIEIWYGLYDVNPNLTSNPQGYFDGSDALVTFSLIPEPSTTMLLLPVALGFILRRRRALPSVA